MTGGGFSLPSIGSQKGEGGEMLRRRFMRGTEAAHAAHVALHLSSN
jgi:hypothetical protein